MMQTSSLFAKVDPCPVGTALAIRVTYGDV